MSVSLPAKAGASFRPNASYGVLAAAAVIAATFTATAFAIAETITTFGVGRTAAALLSAIQVAGFTVANLTGNRLFTPSSKLAKRTIIVFAVANLSSAFAPTYLVLMALRLVAGFAMGLMTWIAWCDTANDARGRGEVTAIGPLAAIVSSVAVAVAAEVAGLRGIYLLLGVLAFAPLPLSFNVSVQLPKVRNPIAVRGIWPMLIAMFVFTAGGSATFVFVTVMAAEHAGLSAVGLSFAMSLNAFAGIPGAKFSGRRRMPGVWMVITGICAFALTQADQRWMFFAILAIWGLAFWTAVPEAFFILQDRSAHPADRIGDAQAAMALGRVLGPVVGGALAGAGSFTLLGIVSFIGMATAGATVQYVASSHRLRN